MGPDCHATPFSSCFFLPFLETNVRGLPPLTLLPPRTHNDPYSHRAFNADCGFPTLNLISQEDRVNANTRRRLTTRIANLVRNNVRLFCLQKILTCTLHDKVTTSANLIQFCRCSIIFVYHLVIVNLIKE